MDNSSDVTFSEEAMRKCTECSRLRDIKKFKKNGTYKGKEYRTKRCVDCLGSGSKSSDIGSSVSKTSDSSDRNKIILDLYKETLKALR